MEKLTHIHLKEPDLKINLEHTTFELVNRVCAEVIDMADEAIVQACIRTAQSVGLTDLFLIDKQFVLDALREKIERENAQKAQKAQKHCAECMNGLFPECQCLTCDRDHGHTEEERGCCMVLGKHCRINNCPDYVMEENSDE